MSRRPGDGRRPGTLRLVVAAGMVLAVAVPAQATDRSRDEAAELVESAAAGEAAAVEQLRATTSVDGKAVDLRSALATDDPDDLSARLDVLRAGLQSGGDLDPAGIRSKAAEILAQRRYATEESATDALAQWIQRQLWRLVSWLDRLISAFPGGPSLFWGSLALAVIAAATFGTLRLGARRNRELEARHLLSRRLERGMDPSELEARARQAAAAGDFREAVRLRFVAGLLRLDQHRRIEFRPGLTTAEVGERLRSRAYDRLAVDFDAIVYGDRPAGAADAEASEAGWGRLLEEARV